MPRFSTLGVVALAAIALAGCGGGGSSSPSAEGPTGGGSTIPAAPTTVTTGTKLSTAKVPGTGTVVVDAKGRTVYAFANGKKNAPCSSACGSTWLSVVLPSGTKAAQAGPGITASLLGTMTKGGKTFLTYNGYLLYEYTGDSAAGEANGSGNIDRGGTWSALSPAGKPLADASYGY
jgi:predicted lipoprotein with Yx(FWY)xxD motif